MSEKVKIFGVCGSARHASTEWAVKLALETAAKYDYVETEFVNLGDYKLVPCVGCMKCFGWQQPADAERPKCYEFEDDSEILLTKMMQSDGVVFGTPIYTLGVTALARIFMEKAHMFGPMSFDKFSGIMRYKPMGVITVGGVDIAGQEVGAQDIWMWAMGLGMTVSGSWPTRDDPNPMASVHGGLVSTCDARTIYGKEALSKKACRTIPPTQGWRNEKSLRNVGRHVAVAAMRCKLANKAFEEGGYEGPEIIPFTRYSVKPKKGSWVQKLMDDGRVEYVSKGKN
ncbi:MAG: flavodoxin family protein [Desulfobacterales bacterium]|nr:flavodoxin family protein [Desulfobacterales bacterium]